MNQPSIIDPLTKAAATSENNNNHNSALTTTNDDDIYHCQPATLPYPTSPHLTSPALLTPAMDQIKSVVDGFIDFEGQSLAETLTTTILVLTGIAAFGAGWILADLKYTVYVGLSGTAMAFLVVVPPWPVYRRNPLSWVAVARMPEEEGGGKKEM